MVVKFEIKGYECLVDDIDADLWGRGWNILVQPNRQAKYVQRSTHRINGKQKTLRLHRLIMARIIGRELLPHELVDHKDRNGLNNTRGNLRLATGTQNQANRVARKHSQTGLKGVAKSKYRWCAHIQVAGKLMYLGQFDTPEGAHEAYKEAAKKYFGEFARWE